MEELRLGDDEVVQHEGWMLKRKAAGFDNDADEAPDASDLLNQLPAQLSPSGRVLEALLLRKTETKRYFVLTTTRGSSNSEPHARLLYCGRKPTIVKGGGAAPPPPAGASSAMRALTAQVGPEQLRGHIDLTDTTDVSLLDGEVRIVNPGRSFYIRPFQDKGKKEKSPEVKLMAGQWYNAIQRAIKDVWEMSRARHSHGSGRDSRHHSNETGGYELPQTLAAALGSKTHRRNFRVFCELSHAVENVEFYERVEEYENKFSALHGGGKGGGGKGGGGKSGGGKSGGKGGEAAAQDDSLLARAESSTTVAAAAQEIKESGGSLGRERSASAAIVSSLASRLSFRTGGGAAPKTLKVPKDLVQLGHEIVNVYVKEGGAKQVNLSDANRTLILNQQGKLGDKCFTPDFFEQSKAEIVALMDANFFMKFYKEEQKKTGCFSKIFGKHHLKGYELVIGHFGKVKTDLDRLIGVYQLRMDIVNAQLRVLGESLHISNDVAVPTLRTTAQGERMLFRANAFRLQALSEFKTQMHEHVVFPLEWLRKSIELMLESIIAGINASKQELADAKQTVEANKRKISELGELQQQIAADAAQEASDPAEKRRTEQRLEQLGTSKAELPAALQTAKRAAPQLDLAVTKSQKTLDDRVVESLDKLEALELHRLQSQQKAIKHAVEAEKAIFAACAHENVPSVEALSKVDAAGDLHSFVKAFATKLQRESDLNDKQLAAA